jgi:hypothetical protein
MVLSMVMTDTDVEWLLELPKCPILGSMETGDWLVPVEELVAFAQERGLAREEVIARFDDYAVAHGGLRVSTRSAFDRVTNVARRLIGRCPVVVDEVWMFEHGHITAWRAGAADALARHSMK